MGATGQTVPSAAARRTVDNVVATACMHASATAKTAAGVHAAAPAETAAATVEAATTTVETAAATMKTTAATAMEASTAAAMAATAATTSGSRLRQVCGDQAHHCAREERGEH